MNGWIGRVATAVLIALLAAGSASAHRISHHRMSLDDRAVFQRAVIRHDGEVLRWFDRHPFRGRTLSALGQIAAREARSRVVRFHRSQRQWTRRELRETVMAVRARDARLKTLVWRRMDRDFETAVRQLDNMLELGIATWVLDCADSEGGRGSWVWNGGTPLNPASIYRSGRNLYSSDPHGSRAGGWMQFFDSTLYNNVDAAYAFARSRGVNVPPEYRSWFSPIGQALTALWMFHNEGSGQWYGGGC